MGELDLYRKKKEYIEDFSLIFERSGRPRIYGLILGWLLICDPPQQSFSELVKHLQVSKSSVSTMTRMLIQAGLIKKVRLPGKRQIHFQIRENAGIDVLEKELELVSSLKQISQRGLHLLKDDKKTGKTEPPRLNEMFRFYTFAADHLSSMIDEYRTKHCDTG